MLDLLNQPVCALHTLLQPPPTAPTSMRCTTLSLTLLPPSGLCVEQGLYINPIFKNRKDEASGDEGGERRGQWGKPESERT